MLRRLAGWAIKSFNNDVKAGKRSKLTLDELREPVDALGVSPDAIVEKSKTQLKKEQSKVRQVKILRQEDRIDILTNQQRSKGYGFLELQNHADALRVVRWANANNDVHKLFHRWWIEALKAYIATAEEAASKNAEEQARLKRMKEKLKELEGEDEDKAGGRQGKTLIIEFSIENAVTVKRRAEKVERVKQKQTQTKRKREDDEEDNDSDNEDEEEFAGEKPQQDETAKKSAPAQGKNDAGDNKSRNPLGSMIGKKRRMAKQKRGGK
jgi:nucleolar protein 4